MKRYLFLLIMFCSTLTLAEDLSVRTTAFTMKAKINSKWSDWLTPEPSNLLINIDVNSRVITIYSQEIQYYGVRECLITELNLGEYSLTMFKVVNTSNEVGDFIVLNKRDGTSNFLFIFDNLIILYNVIL